MKNDLRYAIRQLLKSPGFTFIAILTLALGIGANVALFSVVNGVLLNPLPYPHPEQLITLHQSKPNFTTGAIPYLNFRDWQKENRSFSSMAISRGTSFSLIGASEAEQIDGRWVSAQFFSTLGLRPIMGRDFTLAEDKPGAALTALISAELWQRRFGAAPEVVGQALNLDGKSYTIVGVLPAGFDLLPGTDVYVPIEQWGNPALQNRAAALGLHGIGRLKPGVTLAQAQADLDRVTRHLVEAYPEINRGNGAALIPLQERLVGDVRPILWTLFGAVGFVLLIACVNVSNLLVARANARTREYALRSALGASRWLLIRQSLTESLLLSAIGGGLGLVVASWGTSAALTILPTALPRAGEITLDGRVLLFTIAVSLLTGTLSGLLPALKTSEWTLLEILKKGGRGSSGGRQRAQGILVALETALALVLLIGAGLMLRSMSALWKVDPGFRAQNVFTFALGLPPALQTGPTEAARANLRELSDKLRAVPGVRAVSFSEGAAPLQDEDDLFFWRDGRPKPASTSEMSMALVYRVEPAYLAAMSIPLQQGRFFTDQDNEHSPRVAVIDRAFAQKFFPNENPIGKRIRLPDDGAPWEIVGVVGHVKQWSLDLDSEESLQAQLYFPFQQVLDGSPSRVGVVMRLENKPGPELLDSIRHAAQSQYAENVIFGAQTMNEVIAHSLVQRRFSMIMLGVFAGVALLLASIGLYGVISHLVGQRQHELGVRIALGASRRDILQLVLGYGLTLVAIGLALGLAAAFALTRLMQHLLFGVTPTDPLTFAGIATLLATVALLACWLPARRATRVDPVVALRYE